MAFFYRECGTKRCLRYVHCRCYFNYLCQIILHMVAAEKEKLSGLNSFRSLISGGGAGVFSTVICAPLDVAKVRMQVQGSLGISKYTGTVSAIQLIYREEKLQGLFKGLGPALMTVPLFWSIYFHTYERMKVGCNSFSRSFFLSSGSFGIVETISLHFKFLQYLL